MYLWKSTLIALSLSFSTQAWATLITCGGDEFGVGGTAPTVLTEKQSRHEYRTLAKEYPQNFNPADNLTGPNDPCVPVEPGVRWSDDQKRLCVRSCDVSKGKAQAVYYCEVCD